MILIREGGKVFVVIGEEQHAVAPGDYRAWSMTLDEGRREYEAEARAAKQAADEAESLAKAQAIVDAVPGAWLVPGGRFGVKRYDVVALHASGRIVPADVVICKNPPTPGGARALGVAPSDVWFRINGGTVLHRFNDTDWGSALTKCGRMYCDNESARGYRGPTKWKRCAKCEAKS